MARVFQLVPADGLEHEEPVDVLFVAGDPELAELYRIKLQLDGYRVTIVDSVDEAVVAVERQPADIIFLDLGELRLQAIASWRALRQEPSMRHTPMILLSRLDARRFVQLRTRQGWCGPPPATSCGTAWDLSTTRPSPRSKTGVGWPASRCRTRISMACASNGARPSATRPSSFLRQIGDG